MGKNNITKNGLKDATETRVTLLSYTQSYLSGTFRRHISIAYQASLVEPCWYFGECTLSFDSFKSNGISFCPSFY